MWVTSSTAKVLTPNAIALGNFDGIHRGHKQVVQPILSSHHFFNDSQARVAQTPIYATVVTFNPHPREFFTGESKKLLTPHLEKIAELQRLGVEQLVLLPFDQELASLSPQQFVEEILVKKLQASLISVGADFRFGHRRVGTSADLQTIATQFGIKVHITSLQTSQNERISSSLIRQALTDGDIVMANRLLGRNYSLTGKVVTGEKLGRTIGFPTANLQLPLAKFLPRYGVYCVRVRPATNLYLEGNDSQEDLNNNQYFGQAKTMIPPPEAEGLKGEVWGVMNIGSRPTVDGKNTTIEVHLLDWCGNLYEQQITVALEQFIRPEQKFSSLDALKSQIAADCKTARTLIN